MKLLNDYSLPEQEALRNEVCADAHDGQINYFLRVCHARGIDPFSGLLYMQIRTQKSGKKKASVQPTVDGSRAAAARTGQYAGSDEPEFDSEDADFPKWCRVTVYRQVKSERYAFTAKCRWREFVPSPPNDFQWKAKPYHMLAKVTEVQALRKAFPECVSATGEDDYEVEPEIESAPVPSVDQALKAKLAVEWTNAVKAFEALGRKESDLLDYLDNTIGPTRGPLTPGHMDALRAWFEEMQMGPSA